MCVCLHVYLHIWRLEDHPRCYSLVTASPPLRQGLSLSHWPGAHQLGKTSKTQRVSCLHFPDAKHFV